MLNGPADELMGLRIFASARDEPRARRATDRVVLGASIVGLAVVNAIASPPPAFVRSLATFLVSFPSFLDGLWLVAADLVLVWAVVLVVASLVRRRRSIARDTVLGALAAVAASFVASRVVTGAWLDIDVLLSTRGRASYPAVRLAVSAAAILTASPHLARPVRRLGRWLVALAAFGTMALGAVTPLSVAAGLLVASVAASLVHLALGSSGGRPSLVEVRQALAELAVDGHIVGAADRQQAGHFRVDAVDSAGQSLVVKVFGRDAHDSALLSTLWRSVWLRESGSPLRLGRLQQVEHEAFLTLLARQSGVHTDVVVTAGATATDDALLVLRTVGRPIGDEPRPEVDDALLDGLWGIVGELQTAGIAHGQVDERRLVVDADGAIGISDFGGGTVAPSVAQRRTDEVQALVTTVLLAGEERGLAVARQALGDDELGQVLPYLQPAVLTPVQRRQMKAADLDLDDVRVAAAGLLEAQPPKLQQLRRITAGSIMRVLLPAIAIMVLISAVGDLDWAGLREAIAEASWWLVAVAFVVTQMPRMTQAVSTLGASPVPLPLGPVYALQLAVSYVNLAIPSAAARISVNVRFFQRHGVPPGAAMATGALDGFTSFIMQGILLLSLLFFTSASLELEKGGSIVGGVAHILVLVLVIVVVALVVLVSVPSWRRFVFGWAARLLGEAWAAIKGLRSPRRLALLLGGSLATEVLFALGLALFVRSLGSSVGLADVLLINITVSLLGGLIPVPGGVGVTEGGLTIGLVRAGVPEEVAFAAVLLSRLASFYLPPVWGWFSLRWLERNGHL